MGKVERLYMERVNRIRRFLSKLVGIMSLVKIINGSIGKLCSLQIPAEQFEDNPNIISKQGLRLQREAAIRGILKRTESGE